MDVGVEVGFVVVGVDVGFVAAGTATTAVAARARTARREDVNFMAVLNFWDGVGKCG